MDELAQSGDVLGHVAFVDQVGRVDPNEELVEDDEEDDQLDESWAFVTATSARKIVFKGNREWEVVFVNNKITDPTKQKIYVFLTLSGKHIAVNYSGN